MEETVWVQYGFYSHNIYFSKPVFCKGKNQQTEDHFLCTLGAMFLLLWVSVLTEKFCCPAFKTLNQKETGVVVINDVFNDLVTL